MAVKREEQMKEITKRLEDGVREMFTSENYKTYLKTLSQFHNYSFNNTMLIAMQKPDATLVTGYSTWNKKFNRHVRRGEKGIQIIAPVPVRKKEETVKFDPETNEPVLRPDGQPEMEETEHIIPRFRVATVFDISQTDGDPLPGLDTPELAGNVENFPVFMEAVRMVSPVPMRYARIKGEAKGYYDNAEKEIVIRDGMSERHTMKTAVYEVTHAMCHDRDIMEELGEKKNQMTREVEAESVAFTVCSFFGLDTSDYSFPYIAGWSGSMEMKELRSSMEFIRKTAGLLIDGITENIEKLQKEKEAMRELVEDDLVFQVAFLGEQARRFYLVDNVGRVDFLRLLHTFAGQKGGNKNPEQFLREHGVHLDLWKEFENPGEEEDMPQFYDVLYMDKGHIVDASTSPTLIRVEAIISRAEYGHTALGREAHNLAVRHAYKLDDLRKTKKLIVDMVHAAENPGAENMQEVMEAAQAEIDALPDNKVGMLQMHEFGFRNDSILPLTMERAAALYHAGFLIYNLHKDGNFVQMHTETDILKAEGMFGVDKAAWENHMAAQSVREEKQEERNMQKETVTEVGKTQAGTVPEKGTLQETSKERIREDYQEVEIFGVPALFSNGRIAEKDVPEGFCRYDLRGSDYDPSDPIAVENRVAFNHAGTLLAAYPIPIPERGFLNLGEELNFTGGISTPGQFRESLAGFDFSVLEEKMQDAIIHANEELLYTGTADRYAIFQIDENGKGRGYLFLHMDFIQEKGMEVEGGDYSLVYGGRLGEQENLDTIYEKFNNSHPEGYTGHSLSVSDVVVIKRGGEVTANFVDRLGFTKLPDFVHQREQLIKRGVVQDLEEKTYPPLYTPPFSYAKEHGETDDYRASRELNRDCKKAVEGAIRENFDGMHLAHDAADLVLEKYGAERVAFILANTVQYFDYDGRFSKSTKEWAKSIGIPDAIGYGREQNAEFIVTSHPAVLDGFIGLARENMREQEIRQEPVLENVQTEAGPSITFYAAEYALTPVLGEYHEGLKTVQEAMNIYDKLPEGKKCLKGIGFCLEDGSDYAGRCELMMAGRLQKEFINDIPHYRDSPLVQKAIADAEEILAEREELRKQSPEKETEPLQTVIPHKSSVTPHQNEEKSAPIPEADQAGTEKAEKGQAGTDKPRTDKKAAVPEKTPETAPKTNRDASGISKKQSVLNALRERQARLKAQEKQGQEEKKPRAHGKGGQEL